MAWILVIGAWLVVLANVTSPLFDLERHIAPKELVLHTIALACLVSFGRRPIRLQAGVVTVTLTAFVVWSALSTVFAVNLWLAARAFGVTFSGFILYLAAREARVAYAHVVILGLTSAAACAALIGIAQAHGFEAGWLATERAPGGTFGNRNFLAHLLVLALPVTLGTVLWNPSRGANDTDTRARGTEQDRWARFRSSLPSGTAAIRLSFSFAALALIIWAVVLTRSRAAWLGAATATAAFGAALVLSTVRGTIGRGPLRSASIAVLIGIAAAIVLPNALAWRSDSPYTETLSRMTDYRAGSGRARLVQYQNSLRLIRDRPLVGVGPGNWLVHYPRVTTDGDPSFAGAELLPTNPWPSSDWVAFATERGPIGAMLLVLTFTFAAVSAARKLALGSTQRIDSRRIARDAIVLLATLAATLVTGAFDAVLLLPAPTFFVFVSVGLLAPTTNKLHIWSPGPGASMALRIGSIVIAATLVLSAAGQVRAIKIAGDGRSRESLQRAARVDPGNHRIRLLLARTGDCADRLPHARTAARMLPYHDAPKRALAACGEQ